MEARRVAAVDWQSNELVYWSKSIESESRMTEMACGSMEFYPPFPFPPRASRGGVGSPHAGSTMRANKNAWHASMPPAPPTRGAAAPLWIPCERGGAELGSVRRWEKKTEHYLETWLQRKTKKSRHGVLT